MNILHRRGLCAACLVLALVALRAQGQQPASAQQPQLDAAEKEGVIGAIIANLNEHYVNHAGARKIAAALRAHQKAGDYLAETDGAALAQLLTRQIRETSHDLHLEVVFSHHVLPDLSAPPPPAPPASYRRAMEESNCTFETVKILPHNIGYLKLNSFPDLSICGPTAKKAMASLNGTDAIILDLRDNHGGYPAMVMLLAAYLFDHPEYLYNPRENMSRELWTRSPIPGNKLGDKPAFVLTSRRTFSGAEHFSYNLKMLKRATMVGETTGGATDVGTFYRLDDHFGMGIRDTNAINPYSEPDWAVNGIKPNVEVRAADALETAVKLAAKTLRLR